MNRFLGRRKTKDGESPVSETPPERPTVTPRPSSKGQSQERPKRKAWSRKKSEPEPELELDVSLALPTVDSFRTSLIMSNLSTRFSMLRDQDDPLSLMGKAMDDSVLVPKRKSRLGDFGYTGGSLSGITETSSPPASVHPPFSLQRNGSYSYGDGYGTDDESSAGGSIMSRARPGEGNMLFGGRQKIYRIPIGDAGAVNNLGGGDSRGMRGRALYEDDVSMSNFQKIKADEKAARLREEHLAQLDRDASIEEMRKDSYTATSPGYDDRRETVSSTNSGPSMMSQSTAATSVAAPSPGLPAGQAQVPVGERRRSKKLYEQGLNQHMQDQQAASIGRLTSNKRGPSVSPRTASPYRSVSAGNLRDRYDVHGRTVSPLLNPRKPSPTASLKAAGQLQPSQDTTPASSRPLSPEVAGNEGEKALQMALDPRDRGMATATGRFNRPKQYNDEQFMQRQMSIQKQQKQYSAKSSPSATGRSSPTSGSPSISKPPNSLNNRPRTNTNRTDRSWSNASAANEARSFSAEKIEEQPEPEPILKSPERQQEPAQAGTFLATDADDESDYEIYDQGARRSSDEQQTAGGAEVPDVPQLSPAREMKHPALRSAQVLIPDGNTKAKRQAWSPEQLRSGLKSSSQNDSDYFTIKETAEPPREPSPVQETSDKIEGDSNLKGLVREHLRHPSNSSSIYPTARTPNAEHAEFDLRVPSMYESHNPWEDEVQPPLPSKPIPSQYTAAPPVMPVNGSQPERREPGQNSDQWREDDSRHHGRGDSTETAYENRAFKSELTQRSKIIAENMRVKSPPPEQKSGSPLLPQSSKNVFESSKRPFGMLKTRPSREGVSSPRMDQPRPSFQSSNNERGAPRSRGRGGPASPAPIGRTLHSKMPRHSEDGPRGSPASELSSRAPRPSTDDVRSGRNTSQTRVMHGRPSPPDSHRGSSPRHRSGSEYAHMDERPRQSSSSRARPSLDTRGIRRDSGNGRSPGPISAPLEANMSQHSFAGSANSSNRMSPLEPRRPAPFSANSTPPLSAVSTPNLVHSSSATSASMVTRSSYGMQEHSGALPTPSTGFFFPNASSAGASPVTTPTTETSGNVPKKIPPKSRPRKPTISKQDISEPTLIASTSAVDTIELPPGASLQNGLRDDFDAVLMARNHPPNHDPSAPAPPPSVPMSPSLDPQQAGGRKKSFFRFGKKEKGGEDTMAGGIEDEPEPRRFRIQRLEDQGGKVGHRTLWTGTGAGAETGSNPTSPMDGPPGGMI